MIHAITGAAGQTGAALVRELRRRGRTVRAIVRDLEKAAFLRELGATTVRADLEDPRELEAALAGADAVYAMAPPASRSSDPIGDIDRLAERFARAIGATSPTVVVVLSSFGALDPRGLIRGVAALEAALRDSAPSVTLLRAAWFLENWRGTIATVREGTLPSFLTPIDRPIAQVAVEDIARVAADRFEARVSGTHVVELEGAHRSSAVDIAAIFSTLLGRPVVAQAIPDAAVVDVVRSFGFSEATAREYRAMVAGFNDGTMTAEHEGQVLRGRADVRTVLTGFLA